MSAILKNPLTALLVSLAVPASSTASTIPGNQQVLVTTSAGEFVIELYPEKAPTTVSNFLDYVKSGFYSGTIFHRVIDGFMIQGGGYSSDFYTNSYNSEKKTNPPIKIESANGLKNDIGWVAMARTQDPNSATSQFFINVANNQGLNYPNPDNYGYAVFGKVVSGMDTVDRIAKTATQNIGYHSDVPQIPITIDSITVISS